MTGQRVGYWLGVLMVAAIVLLFASSCVYLAVNMIRLAVAP